MKSILPSLAIISLASTPCLAQDEAPIQAQAAAAPAAHVLAAGTQIPVKVTQAVTTKGDSWKEGDQFNLAVASNVMLGDYIVIPAGTKAVGRIKWLTSRGAFGKSGKMDVELEYLDMGGRRISLDGTYRQEGNGATLATIGGVIAAGVFAGFITGRSAVIPEGRELTATLESDLPVALPEGANVAPKLVQAMAVQPAKAAAATPEIAAPPAQPQN